MRKKGKKKRKNSLGKKLAFNEKLEESGFEKSRKERKIQGIIYSVLYLILFIIIDVEAIRVFALKVGTIKEFYVFIVCVILFFIVSVWFCINADITLKKAVEVDPLIRESDLEEARVLNELLIAKKVDTANEKALDAIASEIEILRNKKTYEWKGAIVVLQVFSTFIFPLFLVLSGGYLQNLNNNMKVELINFMMKLCIPIGILTAMCATIFSTLPFRRANKFEKFRQGIRKLQIVGVEEIRRIGIRGKDFKTKEAIYDWEHMREHVERVAKKCNLNDTLKSIEYAVESHYGQTRKNSEVPYIYHPLNMVCHALAMGIRDDALISAILLHDVIEDCGKEERELPVGDESKEIVRLMTRRKSKENTTESDMEMYYNTICCNVKASITKCIDRCNNLTTMSWGLSKERMFQMIKETERYYPKLLETIKKTSEYNDVAWLLKYQMESMLDIYKRLL